MISSKIQERLYDYIRGIIRNHKGIVIEIGGMADHIHILLKLSNLDNFSHIIRDIKSSSSRWIHENFLDLREFCWQEGYGSFTVNYSSLEQVCHYIKNQANHHKNMTFEEEYLKFLNRCRVKYDERFIFG